MPCCLEGMHALPLSHVLFCVVASGAAAAGTAPSRRRDGCAGKCRRPLAALIRHR